MNVALIKKLYLTAFYENTICDTNGIKRFLLYLLPINKLTIKNPLTVHRIAKNK